MIQHYISVIKGKAQVKPYQTAHQLVYELMVNGHPTPTGSIPSRGC